MDEKNNDDLLLPGFRFHPTDEELVEFYLKRKLHKQPLPFELIKQVDIYKYDPWDLPKLASTGEKEWYFFCPRDRKYKNSTRPNRVTGSGFWKATGTDRPICLSGGIKCIGFKKSLVFYRGKAAKSMKTDWMMHEFRLASNPDGANKNLNKNFHISDSMALCRIFRKSVSMAHRHLSYPNYDTQLNPGSFSSATEKQDNVSALDLSSYKTITDTSGKPSVFTSSDSGNFPGNYHFFDFGEVSGTTDKITTDASNMILNLSPDSKTFEFIEFEGPQQLCNGFPANSLQEIVNIENEEEGMDKDSWGILWDSSLCP